MIFIFIGMLELQALSNTINFHFTSSAIILLILTAAATSWLQRENKQLRYSRVNQRIPVYFYGDFKREKYLFAAHVPSIKIRQYFLLHLIMLLSFKSWHFRFFLHQPHQTYLISFLRYQATLYLILYQRYCLYSYIKY